MPEAVTQALFFTQEMNGRQRLTPLQQKKYKIINKIQNHFVLLRSAILY